MANYQFTKRSYVMPYAPMRSQYGWSKPQQPSKRSGCRMKQHTDGRVIVSGWRKTRQGFQTFVLIQNSKGGNGKTKNPRWFQMTGKIVNKDSGMTQTIGALWDDQKHRVKFQDLGLVANPSAPNGGYWGRGGFSSSKIRRN